MGLPPDLVDQIERKAQGDKSMLFHGPSIAHQA
ncbi:hypothetical protein TP2_12295 [Thioclava pacifica DSM 10166]|uniref:Uncharacterized protein n=1 Tax=Thioclava pacifica DSM 10166 TaxID=1353537 RepID=A0A074J6G1_9RHOB|nr:hypothetical protein TP2_12295 [Thioclava pacifica DSM 10166]